MSDQDRPEPPPSEPPFEPVEPGGPSFGVDRRVLYGCGVGCLVVAVLAAVVLGTLVLKGASLMRWALMASRDALAEAAPEDWEDADQRRLEDAFRHAASAVEEGRAGPEELDEVRRRLLHCLRRAGSGELDRRDLERLVAALERVGREEAGGEERAEAPAHRRRSFPAARARPLPAPLLSSKSHSRA